MGLGNSGSEITVAPSWTTKTFGTKTAPSGRWDISIPTPAASFTPYTISIKGDGSDIRLDDVLSGEVWFCSGQSNMEMPIKGFWTQPVEGEAEAVATAGRYPGIRMAKVPKRASYEPQDSVPSP